MMYDDVLLNYLYSLYAILYLIAHAERLLTLIAAPKIVLASYYIVIFSS